ncbi:hypothetical protein T492DRAFT_496035 [Pavlovales sp. CCMP2436]|nr:hypothetical protein T492DRAFT_496035 [Pavlovales sp. CCMP2436]
MRQGLGRSRARARHRRCAPPPAPPRVSLAAPPSASPPPPCHPRPAGADPYRTVPGLETPIALLRKWAGADPKGEVAVRAIATLWEQNGGGDQEAAGDEGDDEGDDDEDEEARGVSESFGDSKRLGRGSKDSKNTSKDGTPPKRDGTTLDADHIDVDNLYGDEDDQLRRRDGDGTYADSDRETNSDAYEEDEEE